ncbi:myosin light chain kinase, smooth muscle-like isoform X3 [Dromaius novaehollandiae]|uniref:myosin light chain kinase, smooth muscle-like isoform X3 n=1 Tax=Dromaius novaehollandiae TaxID=8790 RepID=UPI00311ED383
MSLCRMGRSSEVGGGRCLWSPVSVVEVWRKHRALQELELAKRRDTPSRRCRWPGTNALAARWHDWCLWARQTAKATPGPCSSYKSGAVYLSLCPPFAELREQLSSYAGSLLAAGSPRVTSCISPHCHLRPSTQQGAGGTTMSQAEAGEEAFEYCNVTINSQEKVLDVYTQLEKLGEGKFGMVYRLQEKATGKIRAGKYFRTRTPKERQAARAEVELMNLLHHPRLVQCLAAFQSPKELVMVMEYVAGGELFERIVDDDFEHTEPSSIQYMRQILEGLQYMHSQAIVHLDLKPENIVCVSPNSHWLKIIDFGLARKLTPDTPVKVLHGTPEFMAPEVVSFEPVGFTTDMWSIGVICYILLSGESPFQGDNDMETLSNVTAAKWEFEEETFSEISQQAKDFISQLLQKDARCRLSSKEALLHPWLQQLVPSSAKVLSKERIKQFLTRRKWQPQTSAAAQRRTKPLHFQPSRAPASQSRWQTKRRWKVGASVSSAALRMSLLWRSPGSRTVLPSRTVPASASSTGPTGAAASPSRSSCQRMRGGTCAGLSRPRERQRPAPWWLCSPHPGPPRAGARGQSLLQSQESSQDAAESRGVA